MFLVSLESLVVVLAAASAPLKFHLLPVFQLLPQPPKPKLFPASLAPAPPKSRSSFGAPSSRFMSSNVARVGGPEDVGGADGAGGGGGGTGSAAFGQN